jgi:hypothetical protein
MDGRLTSCDLTLGPMPIHAGLLFAEGVAALRRFDCDTEVKKRLSISSYFLIQVKTLLFSAV